MSIKDQVKPVEGETQKDYTIRMFFYYLTNPEFILGTTLGFIAGALIIGTLWWIL